MTTTYDVIFPEKGRQLFDGGLNSKFERSIIGDNESPDCYNVIFTAGAVETRPGVTKLNTLTVGTFVGDGLYTRHDNSGAETMIVWAGGTAYDLATTTFTTIGSAQSVFTAGNRVAAAEAENYIFFGNGGTVPYKWNGTNFTRHGVTPGTQTMTVASGAAGNLAGVYSWKYTNVNTASVESDLGPAVTFTVTSTGGQVTLAAIPTAPASHGVNARYIYRTNAGGSTYFRVGTLSDNTTTSVADNLASASAGVTAPSDNGLPPNYNALAYHGGLGRMFMNDPANPNYVWYTPALQPYTVNRASAFIPIGDKSFDIVRGVDIYDNGVVVYCNRGIYLIVTPSNTPTDWGIVRLRTPYGCKSPFSGFLFNNKLMFAAIQNTKLAGFAAISGSTIDQEATYLDTLRAGSDLASDRIEPIVFDCPELYLPNISAMVYKNKAYISFTKTSGNTTNNRVLVFDFSIANLTKNQRDAWSILSGVNAAQFTVYNAKLYFLDSTATGFVRQLETTSYNDDGSAINSYFWTKEFSGRPGHENLQKDFRYVKLLVEKSGNYAMNLTYRVDSDASDAGTTLTLSLSPGGNTWGNFNWGGGVWGAGRSQDEVIVTLGQVTGKRIQLKFSNQNTAGQKFKVHGMNIGYNIKGKR